jgi:hypothetical protein
VPLPEAAQSTRARAACLAVILVGLLGLSGTVPLSSALHGRSVSTDRFTPAWSNPGFTLSGDGASPGTIGLHWVGKPGFMFNHYEVYESVSGSSGPWTDLGSVPNALAQDYFVEGLSANTSYWWDVVVSYGPMGSNDTNVLYEPTTAAPSVSVRQTAVHALNVSWTDPANYSGVVGFVSYQLYETGPNGTERIATLAHASERSWTVPSVTNNTTVSFEVQATTQCVAGSDCNRHTPTSSAASPLATITTAATMALAVAARPGPGTVGSPVQFVANLTGGAEPFNYVWEFGDGATATGPTATHRYATNATFQVTCTVTDAFSSVTRADLSVKVVPAATNSSGGGGHGGKNSTTPPPTSPTAPGSKNHAPRPASSDLGPFVGAVLILVIVAFIVLLILTRPRAPRSPPPRPPDGAATVYP